MRKTSDLRNRSGSVELGHLNKREAPCSGGLMQKYENADVRAGERNPAAGAQTKPRAVQDTIIRMFREDSRTLNLKQMMILFACEGSLEQLPTIGALATYLRIDRPAVTRAVDHLERLNFLLRIRDPTDRRIVLLSVTPSGRAFANRCQD
jgi:DNA-binding MarR family transcriptional regulator